MTFNKKIAVLLIISSLYAAQEKEQPINQETPPQERSFGHYYKELLLVAGGLGLISAAHLLLHRPPAPHKKIPISSMHQLAACEPNNLLAEERLDTLASFAEHFKLGYDFSDPLLQDDGPLSTLKPLDANVIQKATAAFNKIAAGAPAPTLEQKKKLGQGLTKLLNYQKQPIVKNDYEKLKPLIQAFQALLGQQ